jgi:hypothetical protein
MSLSHQHIGSKILAKIEIYIYFVRKNLELTIAIFLFYSFEQCLILRREALLA